MKIGIIVYSQTGNTYSVAQNLKEKLKTAGHVAEIERVTSTGEATPGSKNFQFDALPVVDPYDLLVFGAPTHAFSLAPVMTAYLDQLSSLKGKKIACFVTKQLPFHWTGGKQAISRMKKICEAKGGTVYGMEIVIWSKSKHIENMRRCITNLGNQILNLTSENNTDQINDK
ncbi:MAG TPA: flavodoxin family protein [Halanaerobiales bacterium]|nr:flavodoxin family protein [Halanaerobiales bacterium]